MEPDSRDPHANWHILRCEIVHCANSNAHTNRHILHALHLVVCMLHAAKFFKEKSGKSEMKSLPFRATIYPLSPRLLFSVLSYCPSTSIQAFKSFLLGLAAAFHSRCPCFRHGKQFSYGITFKILSLSLSFLFLECGL